MASEQPMRFQRGDHVYMTLSMARDIPGSVKRAARDGSWVDVQWRSGAATWTTRVRASVLTKVEATHA